MPAPSFCGRWRQRRVWSRRGARCSSTPTSPLPVHIPGQVLVDLAVAIADGARSISDLVLLRDQPSLFGPVASTATAWRALDRVSGEHLVVRADAAPRTASRRPAGSGGSASASAFDHRSGPSRGHRDPGRGLVTGHRDRRRPPRRRLAGRGHRTRRPFGMAGRLPADRAQRASPSRRPTLGVRRRRGYAPHRVPDRHRPPERSPARSPGSSSATVDTPGSRTASARPKRQGCATCRVGPPRRTTPGSRCSSRRTTSWHDQARLLRRHPRHRPLRDRHLPLPDP
jgi:hypothetical protein